MAEENGALCYYGSLDRGFNVTFLQICLFQVLEAHAARDAYRCSFRVQMSTWLIFAAAGVKKWIRISQLSRENSSALGLTRLSGFVFSTFGFT